jgi:filamentous hemagglutinin family protein
MTQLSSHLAFGLFLTLVSSLIHCQRAIAQIIPDNSLGVENSRTRTDIIKNIPSDVIEGGATRGSNLFHSFREFSIKEGSGAYFANPAAIQNIFTRVTGGKVSNISGTLGVLGDANLFLINPNGIIFGTNARLDIRGAFTASTANSLLFDHNFEFSATNPDAPPLLTVDLPIGLKFREQPGDINSTANLTTPGNLTLQAGNLNLSGSVVAGGDLTLEAQNNLSIRDTVETPFIAASGQDLLIKGNQVDIFALNNPNSGIVASGNLILKSPNPIIGDAHYWSGGSFRIEKLDGSLGGLVSLNDPVIRSLGDVSFDSYQGASLHIIAGGKVETPGSIIITEPDLSNGLFENITLSNSEKLSIAGFIEPTLDIRAGVDSIAVGMPLGQTGIGTFIPFVSLVESPTSADIIVGDVIVNDALLGSGGKVILTNQYFPNKTLFGEIKVNYIDTQDTFKGGSVILDSRNNIKLDGMIYTTSFLGKGGDIQLLAVNDITINSDISTGSRGDINVKSNSILLKNRAILSTSSFSSLSNSISEEREGNITIQTKHLTLENNTGITTGTFTAKDAGDLTIFASNLLEIKGGNITTGTNDQGKGGNLSIHTGQLIVRDRGNVSASSNGAGNAGDINIDASQSVELLNGGVIQSQANETGNGGVITIKAPRLILQDEAGISVATQGKGGAEKVIINAPELVEVINSNIISSTFSFSPAGDIEINTKQLIVRDNGLITTLTSGAGDAGNLTIDAKQLSIQEGAVISTETASTGNAGHLTIKDSDSITVSGQGDAGISLTTTVRKGATGKGGDLTITTGRLVIQNGAQVAAGTFGDGDSGKITITADSVELKGRGSGLFTQTEAQGTAGNLTLKPNNNNPNLNINFTDNGFISASTTATGKSGNINLNAPKIINIQGNGKITVETSGSGNAGKIDITAETLNLANGLEISASTNATGKAGDILLNIKDNLNLTNSAIASSTTSNSTGKGGSISIDPININLDQKSRISVNSQGQGNGGDISLIGQNLNLNNSSEISAVTASGEGGNISLNLANIIRQRNNSLISATAGGTGNGGNIKINTNSLIGSRDSDIAANAFQGRGGNINITARGIFQDRRSEITASSQLGIDGIVEINTPEVDPSQGLVDLPQNPVDPNSLISQNACRKGGQSKFTVTGRGGLPASPEQIPSSNEIEVSLVEATQQESSAKTNYSLITTRKIVPAQGWQRNEKGEIVLVAYPTANTANRQVNSLITCSSN